MRLNVVHAAVVAAHVLAAHSNAGAQTTPKGDRALGEYLAAECVGCHQKSGASVGAIPAIVAWPEDQFIAVLLSYKEKVRDNATMQTIAARLSREDIEALAAFFGALPAHKAGN